MGRSSENLVIPSKYITELQKIHKDLLDIYQSLINPEDEVLDIGCGNKIITRYLKCKKLTGVDAFEDYLTKFDVLGDMLKIKELVPEKSYDVLFCLDAIEHLEKDAGMTFLGDMESVARKKIVLFTPTFWTDNSEAVLNPNFWSYGNQYNYHKSLWTIEDFLAKGYKRIDFAYNDRYIIVVKEF